MNRLTYSSRFQGKVLRIIPELIRARELLVDLVWKDLRAQYRRAVLGFMWAVIEPLMMTLVLTVVFTVLLQMKMGNGKQSFAVMLLCAFLFWKFLADALSSASHSLVDNRTLIGKVNFPREVVPLASVGFCLVNLVIGLVIYLPVSMLLGTYPGIAYVWLPFVFAIQLALVVGLSLIFSCLNAWYRDVSYIVGVGLVFGFYGTPIFYDLNLIRGIAENKGMEWVVTLMFINPMVGLVTSYRDIMVHDTAPSVAVLIWPAILAVTVLLAGVLVFRKRSGTLSDYL